MSATHNAYTVYDDYSIVAFEPGSSFVFPEKELPAPMPSAYDTLKDVPVPMEKFLALTKIPILIIYGDNIPDKPVAMPAQDSSDKNDGIQDINNMPLDLEPECVIRDLCAMAQ